jgi:hypothetical protein
MYPLEQNDLQLTRRQLLSRGRTCVGAAALASLLAADQQRSFPIRSGRDSD